MKAWRRFGRRGSEFASDSVKVAYRFGGGADGMAAKTAIAAALALLSVSIACAAEGPDASVPQPQDQQQVDLGGGDVPDADPAALLSATNPLGEIVDGVPDAPVTVVEYSSLTCDYSADWRTKSYPKIADKFVRTGKVRWVFREYADDSVSKAAFHIALCIDKTSPQRLIDGMFARQRDFVPHDLGGVKRDRKSPREALYSIARSLGMDPKRFGDCIADPDIAQGLKTVLDEAVTKFKVNATPVFFVNGRALSGDPSPEDIEAAISAALAKP